MYSIFLDFFKSFSIDIFFAISLFALYAVVNLPNPRIVGGEI